MNRIWGKFDQSLKFMISSCILATFKYNVYMYIYVKKMSQDISHYVEVSSGDAYTLIVSNTLEFAECQTVIVGVEDTELLVMLVYCWRSGLENIFIRHESMLS